jgi:hypothetical protein
MNAWQNNGIELNEANLHKKKFNDGKIIEF